LSWPSSGVMRMGIGRGLDAKNKGCARMVRTEFKRERTAGIGPTKANSSQHLCALAANTFTHQDLQTSRS
ncbi:MAG: hypothetical protein WAT41_06950, partial [Flavobacteriales bacterium]